MWLSKNLALRSVLKMPSRELCQSRSSASLSLSLVTPHTLFIHLVPLFIYDTFCSLTVTRAPCPVWPHHHHWPRTGQSLVHSLHLASQCLASSRVDLLSAVRDQGTHMHLHTRNPHDDLAQCVLSLVFSLSPGCSCPPRARALPQNCTLTDCRKTVTLTRTQILAHAHESAHACARAAEAWHHAPILSSPA